MILHPTWRIVTFALFLTAALDAAVLTSPAHADDAATLTVVGTSDVFDSNLVQTVLKPGFQAAYPQYTLNYVSKGTGAAIAYAEAGTASALLVHAAALENQFVDQGYSAEPYGRAIFWGDYVLLGTRADPAGVMTSGTASHDIVGAFEKIAAAGADGTANFVSRGGTPGTTVQEHAIWALTSGVTTCEVSAANGGGTSPSTATGACPSSISYPSWYHATGLTQGPNIVNADACNYSGGGCYVITDRGTFQYLESTGALSNVQIVTRDNDVAGQLDLLVNSFHAYAIDPAKFAGNPNVQINLPAATAFLDWVTSPAGQAAVGAYLNDTGDAPFLPSAAPQVGVRDLPDSGPGGTKLKLIGSLTNAVPGTPALDGVRVRLLAVPASAPGAAPVQVASGLTDDTGRYSFGYTPHRTQLYTLHTDAITKIENATLDPVFGDLLAPASVDLGRVKVLGRVHVDQRSVVGRSLRLTGTLTPRVSGAGARLVLFAGHPGAGLHQVGTRALGDGDRRFEESFHLGSGTWKYQLRYVNPGVIQTGRTGTTTVSVP